MTPEQFIYWLSGYMTASGDNDAESVVDDIKKAMKEVKCNPTEIYMTLRNE